MSDPFIKRLLENLITEAAEDKTYDCLLDIALLVQEHFITFVAVSWPVRNISDHGLCVVWGSDVWVGTRDGF